MRETLIVWDIDGTLINGRGCGRKAMDEAFYRVYKKKNGFADIKMAGRLDAVIVKDALEKNNVGENNIKQFFDIYCHVLEDVIENNDDIEILPGVREILKEKKFNNIMFHVLGTGNIERGARIKLKSHDLNKYFPVGGFGDEALERWQIILKAIERAEEFFQINFNKENIYVIGDTPFDIECGKILGIKSVAVSTGSYSAKDLMEHNPDYVLNSLKDTEKFFSIFEKKSFD